MNARLEIGRGLAALWVFAFHVQPMIAAASAPLGVLASYGDLGVPVFFVVSGYAMYASAERDARPGGSWSNFLKRRLLRIYPPFWAAVIVAVCVPFLIEAISSLKSGTFTSPSPRWLEFGALEWAQVVSLTRVFTAVDGNLQATFSPVNAVFWTLAIEVQFYLVMTLAVAFGARWRWVLAVVTVLSLVSWLIEPVRESGLFLAYWPAFMFGLLLRYSQDVDLTPAWLFGRFSRWVGALALAGIGATLVILLAATPVSAPEAGTFDAVEFVTAALIASIVLWFSMAFRSQAPAGSPRAQATKLLKPLLMIGACSYSLYLIHGRIYPLTEMFVRQVFEPGNLLYPTLTIGSTVFVAYLFYVIVERPFMSTRNRSRAGTAVAAKMSSDPA